MTNLSRFRVDAPAKPRQTGLDTLTLIIAGRGLCIDQSLSASGLVMIQASVATHSIAVVWTAMVKTEQAVSGNRGTLLRAALSYRSLASLLEEYRPDWVVHEQPPTSFPGARMKRPESSLVAATVVHCACAQFGVPVFIKDAKRVKNVLTGNPNAEKSEVRAAVKRLVPAIAEFKPANENTYDAMALGIVFVVEGDVQR